MSANALHLPSLEKMEGKVFSTMVQRQQIQDTKLQLYKKVRQQNCLQI